MIGTRMTDEHTTNEHIHVKDMEMTVRLCLQILKMNHELSGH